MPAIFIILAIDPYLPAFQVLHLDRNQIMRSLAAASWPSLGIHLETSNLISGSLDKLSSQQRTKFNPALFQCFTDL